MDSFRLRLQTEGTVTFPVRARPGARVSRFRRVMDDGSLKIDIAAAADDGKANAELLRFLGEEFQVPISHIQIVSGGAARQKIIRITA